MKITQGLKLILAVVSAFLVFFAFEGCGDDTIVTSGPPGSTALISGSIDNWPADSLVVKAIVSFLQVTADIGIDTVEPPGIMNLVLGTPPQIVLDNIADFIGDTTASITFSDTSAMVAHFEALAVFADSLRAGDVDRRNFGADSNFTAGSFTVDYIYTTKNVSVNGTVNLVSGSDTNRVTYNLNLNTGWNTYTVRLNERRENFSALSISTGSEPAGARWYFTIANP